MKVKAVTYDDSGQRRIKNWEMVQDDHVVSDPATEFLVPLTMIPNLFYANPLDYDVTEGSPNAIVLIDTNTSRTVIETDTTAQLAIDRANTTGMFYNL